MIRELDLEDVQLILPSIDFKVIHSCKGSVELFDSDNELSP